MESTATAESPNVAATAAVAPVMTPKPVAPSIPTVNAPAYRGPRQARADWDSLQQRLAPDGELAVDMHALPELKRPAIAQVIRFLQRAEAINTQVVLTRVPPKTHAMLEILGIHHLVEIQSSKNA